MEAAENLIRQANLAKIRGDNAAFDKLLEQAAAKAPGSSMVQEAIGDSYRDRRQLRKAKEAWQMAVKLDPKNASAERKFGEAVLAIQLAIDPKFATAPDDDSFASGRAAVILSFLLPGLGQLVAGQSKKGAFYLGLWLIGVIAMLAIPNGLSGMPALFGRKAVPFNPVVFVPMFFSAAAWLMAITDASSKAKSMPARMIQRPLPPVDKDFEL
ncbi:MAG: hypothetical protein JSS66_00570 [Armatimonadetes bacterium]|nr:hypothetical protein [Armatimonadota bacterium]